ncbi:MAG TPA: hypothetical protein VHN18_15285 [Micromonosporaceae bacterium]|nr:hypothetical protein [Micromonosporaceae bacterium]
MISRLATADDDEFRRLAEPLAHIQDWHTLHTLVERAKASDDPHTQEVGDDLTERYEPTLSREQHDVGNP